MKYIDYFGITVSWLLFIWLPLVTFWSSPWGLGKEYGIYVETYKEMMEGVK